MRWLVIPSGKSMLSRAPLLCLVLCASFPGFSEPAAVFDRDLLGYHFRLSGDRLMDLIAKEVVFQNAGPGAQPPLELLLASIYEAPESSLDDDSAARLAEASFRIGDGVTTRGRCLAGVATALVASLGSDENFYNLPRDKGGLARRHGKNPGRSAHNFMIWARDNPRTLCERFGLARVAAAGRGSVHLFEKGRCGFSRRHGHAEIAVGDGTFCSDHCRLVEEPCAPDLILAPVTSCLALRSPSHRVTAVAEERKTNQDMLGNPGNE